MENLFSDTGCRIATILLTRRCNYRCYYCGLSNPQRLNDLPPEYQMDPRDERPYTDWIRLLERLRKDNDDIFIILLGGEPFLYKDLPFLVKELNDQKFNYTIISNCSEELADVRSRFFDHVGHVVGFTASVDPSILRDDSDEHSVKKSRLGYDYLKYLIKHNLVDDPVAEITVTDTTLDMLYHLVAKLSKDNIWSDITVVDQRKSPYYDFSSVENSHLLVKRDKRTLDMFTRVSLDKTLKVHLQDTLLDMIYSILPCDLLCNLDIYGGLDSVPYNMVFDADGTVRLCLRIKGIRTPTNLIENIYNGNSDSIRKMNSDIANDYMELCQGCSWTCPLIAQHQSKEIIGHHSTIDEEE